MKKRINFNARISNMLRAMLQEMWKTIEERAKTDERYDAPKRFLERTYDRGKNFCEVDINGCSYPVSGIRLEKPWHGGPPTITSIPSPRFSRLLIITSRFEWSNRSSFSASVSP